MRWKSHVRFGRRPGETEQGKPCHRAPSRPHLAGDALDQCRRRIQQQLHGHRGRAIDPLYRARRTLHTGLDLLTARQKARLEALFAGDDHVEVEAHVETIDRTGVEMEAMTAASIAALTIYDMSKSTDRDMKISDLQLWEKTGGRLGVWKRQSDEEDDPIGGLGF